MTQALVATRPLCRISAAWSGGGPTRAWRDTQRGARCKVTGRAHRSCTTRSQLGGVALCVRLGLGLWSSTWRPRNSGGWEKEKRKKRKKEKMEGPNCKMAKIGFGIEMNFQDSFSCLLVLHPACVRRRGRPTQAPPAERAVDGSTAREEPGETRSEVLLHVGFLRCFLKNGELNVVKSFSSEITGAGVCTSRRKYRHAGCHAALAPGWLFGCRYDRRLVLWNQKEIEGVAE
uniref:Uncharacterized protein n=1 Tax=Oryza nivara TaxID=4536 RepID=A0A0E0IE78_ORYNI